jgi:NAD(P)-dependent dehydrogenase (short-subunit alcohol dehydrogenase family)
LAPTWNVVGVYRSRHIELPTQDQRLINPLRPLDELSSNQHPIFAFRADLFADAEVDALINMALSRFGHVDALVNAAVHSRWSPILADNRLLDSLLPQFFLNAIVPVKLATLLAWQTWNDDRSGERDRVVVNVSSTAAQQLYPGRGQSGYAASKAALETLTRHMAVEFADIGVRVNAVSPEAFPNRVGVDEVVHAICDQLQGTMSGEIRCVGARHGSRV